MLWSSWRYAGVLIVLAIGILASNPAHAAYYVFNTPPEPVRNTYGEIGTFDMPSARMAPDGEFGFTLGDIDQQQRYNLSFQALPWLDTTYRFSHVVGTHGGYDNRHFYDRSIGFKIRLMKEDGVFPDLAVGIRDILGTGVYSSEYIVASKSLGPFDFSAGLGWGTLSQRAAFPNPVGLIVKSAKTRGNYSSFGGTVNFGMFFRGPNTGAFGSVAWQSPIDGLELLAEFSSDKYNTYTYEGGVKVRTPVNVGLSYKPLETFAMSAGWFYGSTYGITLSIHGDVTKTYPSAMRIGPTVPPAVIRTDVQRSDALKEIQSRNAAVAKVRAGRPWTQVPTAEQYAQQKLLQIFLSETSGVRGVEAKGKSLIIDARIADNPASQCARYAQVARASQAEFTSLALVDLQSPDGQVHICRAATELATAAMVDRIKGSVAAAPEAVRSKVEADLLGQGISYLGLAVGANEAWLYYENFHYSVAMEAAGRAARILMADLPPNIEVFHLAPSTLGLELPQMTVYRSNMEHEYAVDIGTPFASGAMHVSEPPLSNPARDAALAGREPSFVVAFDPKVTEHLYDPDHPIQFMIFGDVTGLVQLAPGLSLSAELTGTIWSNYTFTRDAGSELQHVRSDILQYLKHGKYGVSALALTYRTRLAPTTYVEVRAGYLEDMFVGAGGQALWRPTNSRFAFGVDAYQVWQRAFNRLYGLQRFDGKHYGVFTGHLSGYYDSPWYGLMFAAHAGRYLAGDYGATFEVSRRFSTGIVVGAWATFTNVPFAKFGEGSFDKGIMIHIPFEWGLPIWSQSSYDLRMASLTRDGGQRLAGDDSLYAVTDSASYGQIMDHLDAFREP